MKTRSEKRQWTQWTEAEGRAAVDAWRASKLSAETFARERGFSAHRLTYWQRRLARARPAFVPVIAPTRSDTRIEIERAGVVLRLREDIDPVILARIVAALAALASPC